MKKIKATLREKMMDSIIANIRRPYHYGETKRKLEEGAKRTHEYLSKLKYKQKDIEPTNDK